MRQKTLFIMLFWCACSLIHVPYEYEYNILQNNIRKNVAVVVFTFLHMRMYL